MQVFILGQVINSNFTDQVHGQVLVIAKVSTEEIVFLSNELRRIWFPKFTISGSQEKQREQSLVHNGFHIGKECFNQRIILEHTNQELNCEMFAGIADELSLALDQCIHEALHDGLTLSIDEPLCNVYHRFSLSDFLICISLNELSQNSTSPFLVLPKRMSITLDGKFFIVSRRS